MKKFIIMSAFGLATVAGLSSCSDFLDTDNKSTITADDQFSDINGWNQLLNQAYYSMRAIYNEPQIFCSGTDAYVPAQGTAPIPLQSYQVTTSDAIVENLYTNTYAAINAANCVLKYSQNDKISDQARFIRAYCYYVLTQQFGAVPYIEAYIESAATSYPRTDLATCYQNMITDLTIIINNGNLDQTSAASDGRGRASILGAKALLAKVYLAAGWDIQTTLTDAEKGNYTINSTDYFAKAAATAAEVANAVPLTQSFDTKWNFDLNEAGNNAETLFAIQYDRATSSDQATGGHNLQHFFGGYMGSNDLGIKAMKNELSPTERVHFAFEKGDERYEGTFMTEIVNYSGNADNWSKEGYWAYYNATAAEKSRLPIAWKFFPWYAEQSEIDAYTTANASRFVTTGYKNVSQIFHLSDNVTTWQYAKSGGSPSTSSYTFTQAIAKIGCTPPVKKYDDKNTTSTVKQSGGSYRDIVVLNASEIYLTAAEAYLMAGDEKNALKYLNAVRDRAHASHLNSFADYYRTDYANGNARVKVGQTDSNGITLNKLDVVLDERLRETLGECYRWMDLRRTKQLVRYNIAYNGFSVSTMTGVDGEIKWLRPIPDNEIQINSGMTSADQNPGYRTIGNDEETEGDN